MMIFLAAIDTAEDKNKFEQIYQAYHAQMYWAAYGILKNQHYAEDAVSQAFFKMIDHLDHIEHIHSKRTQAYVITIAEHTAIDCYRKIQRENTTTLDEWEVTSEYSEAFSHGDNDVASAINSLPVNYAIVLRLRYSQGYSDEEIAQMLDITQENVRTRVKRAKKKLKVILEERGVQW